MNDILKKLVNLSDIEYKKFNSKLCPDTQKEMLGIRIPILRKLAKDILKENIDWKDFLNNDPKYFEETILQGLLIAYSKINFQEKMELVKNFVPKIDSWEICDTFVPTLKIEEKNLNKFWGFILPYTKSNKEFEVRFSIISMLDYFLNEEYVDEVIKVLDKISHDGYYVKMGIAWVLAEIGIKYNNKLMKYLKGKNNLDKFTFNKTLQKMIESYRITKEEKEILKCMKKK